MKSVHIALLCMMRHLEQHMTLMKEACERREIFLKDDEIIQRLIKTCFVKIKKKYFYTQWFLPFVYWLEAIEFEK
jgi:hypothetical protein